MGKLGVHSLELGAKLFDLACVLGALRLEAGDRFGVAARLLVQLSDLAAVVLRLLLQVAQLLVGLLEIGGQLGDALCILRALGAQHAERFFVAFDLGAQRFVGALKLLAQAVDSLLIFVRLALQLGDALLILSILVDLFAELRVYLLQLSVQFADQLFILGALLTKLADGVAVALTLAEGVAQALAYCVEIAAERFDLLAVIRALLIQGFDLGFGRGAILAQLFDLTGSGFLFAGKRCDLLLIVLAGFVELCDLHGVLFVLRLGGAELLIEDLELPRVIVP